mmetsp:Transcript_74093/g.196860  ORF Transcript_74093/g.196860 Transcript_74093/m.196860 type:complete len:217 (-) Transcript_74093:975-1625(-)
MKIRHRLDGSARGSIPVVSQSRTSSPFMVISAGGAAANLFWKALAESKNLEDRHVMVFLPQASACAFVPPKPKDETPEYALSSRRQTVSVTIWQGKPSISKCGFCALMWRLGAASQKDTCKMHLAKPQKPAPPSPWPTLDLEEVITSGCFLGVALMTFLKALTSMGSPSEVPVPWHSKQSTSVGVSAHSRRTELMHFSCAGPFGAVRLALRPSWLA